jgi:hypothetical protein
MDVSSSRAVVGVVLVILGGLAALSSLSARAELGTNAVAGVVACLLVCAVGLWLSLPGLAASLFLSRSRPARLKAAAPVSVPTEVESPAQPEAPRPVPELLDALIAEVPVDRGEGLFLHTPNWERSLRWASEQVVSGGERAVAALGEALEGHPMRVYCAAELLAALPAGTAEAALPALSRVIGSLEEWMGKLDRLGKYERVPRAPWAYFEAQWILGAAQRARDRASQRAC